MIEVLGAITKGEDAFLAFTVMMIVLFIALLYAISR
jgi:hypothetical protein